MTENITGIVERITFQNKENGFVVLRVNVKGHKDLVTVVGNVASVGVGEQINASGVWFNDRAHGLQFKAEAITSVHPNSLDGIEKYLGSGAIKGIGPFFAKKLVEAFGEKVLEVIEKEPHSLSKVTGIGKTRAGEILKNWHDQRKVREIMVFLQTHALSSSMAHRIYKKYGDDSVAIVSKNPYKLAQDIKGIGFHSADVIAGNLGIAKDSIIRARSGINYVLQDASSRGGHSGLPIPELIAHTKKLIEIEEELTIEAIEAEIAARNLIKDSIAGQEVIFLAHYYYCEKGIAALLKSLNNDVPQAKIRIEEEIKNAERDLSIKLAAAQKEAIWAALTSKLMVITGGPGTGKTTLVNSILYILKSKKVKIQLCAPTGRAAKRLTESTKLEALTIHRLLEVDPTFGGFKRNEDNRLDCDYLVVDESSMIDILLMHALLKAIPDHAVLLFVGDVDQLPSVGPGQVLRDLIESQKIKVVKLTEIFRQAASSEIIKTAHLVNQGKVPDLTHKADSDFYFIEAAPGEQLMNKLINMITDRIPKKFGCDPVNDIQVLVPMQRGGFGVKALNIELQKVLNPNFASGILRYGQNFAIGDKVMQMENNYDKEVYNGDIGIISEIDAAEEQLVIKFDHRYVKYNYTDLDQISHAYATTIHKSQGSEYKIVIIPLTMQSYIMLQKNLIYTAITRGKEFVVLIGEKEALEVGVKKNDSLLRYSKLREWLVG
jgi:exodeoxyribonuclease V alpha subunit